MEGGSKQGEICPRLLDLIPKDRDWLLKRDKQRSSHGCSQEKNLELRLGPPGEEDWKIKDGSCIEREEESNILSLGYFSNMAPTSGAKRGFKDTVEMKTVEKKGWIVSNNNGTQNQKFSASENPVNPVGTGLSSPWSSSSSSHQVNSPFHQLKSNPGQSLTVMAEESSQCCNATAINLLEKTEKKAFSAAAAQTTAVPNSAQKRTGSAPVVGWPPIRSFRKNLASSSSSSKPTTPEAQNVVPSKVPGENPVESCRKGFFVKINMDGVPIGRKVDLEAYGSYEKLSSSVDELFRDLLAAQRNSSAGGIQKKQEGEKVIKGLLDGSGEYTLVYEDNEGDRILVGDVPWHMFVSTVKRLRVLKSSELSAMCLCSKRGKILFRDPPK